MTDATGVKDRWEALQAIVERELPEENWMLGQLDVGGELGDGPDVRDAQAQAILSRTYPDGAADQVLGLGDDDEAAVRDAIERAREMPPT
ncbi:MAG: hypothetical protein ACR2OU_20335 [Thermomicrobiales bacterium]